MRRRTTIFLSCLVFCFLISTGPFQTPFALSADAPGSQEKIIPLDLKDPLDIHKLTLDKYRRVAGAAREGMKIVQGDMAADEAKDFEKKWAVMADFPTAQAVDYLNRLNPLLVEFLKLRGVVYTASEEFDSAWAEGTLAAGYGNAAGAEEAFAIAAQQKNLLQSIQARLAAVTEQIQALGDPPDQAEAKRKGGRKHDDALKNTKKIIKAAAVKSGGKSIAPLKRTGVIQITPSVGVIDGLSTVEFTAEASADIAGKAKFYYWQWDGSDMGAELYTTEPRITIHFPHNVRNWDPGVLKVNVEAHQIKGRSIASGRVYIPVRKLNFAEYKAPEPFTGGVEYDNATQSKHLLYMKTSLAPEYPHKGVDTRRLDVPRIENISFLKVEIIGLNAKDKEYKLRDIANMWKSESRDWYTVVQKKTAVDLGFFAGEIVESTRRTAKTPSVEGSEWLTFGKGLLTQKKSVPASAHNTSYDHVWIEYEVRSNCANCLKKQFGDYTGVSDKWANDALRKIAAAINAVKPDYDQAQGAQPEPEDDTDKPDPEVIKETIKFHESNIAILEKNLAREQEDLGKEKDDKRREAFEFRVLTLKADIQAERDLIASLQTGTIIHTRTEFDDYTRDQFISNIRANQIRMEIAQRQAAEAYRIAELLPPGEAEEAKKFVDRQLTPELIARADLTKIGAVNGALVSKAQGYYEKAKAQEEIASAEKTLMVLNGLQGAGNIAATFIGGQAGAAAYAGFTGFITGGPADAVRGAASWYNTATYVAVEAYDGYMQGGYYAGKGLAGAAEKAAAALAMGKLFEYGLQKVGTTTGLLSQPATREQLKQRLEEFKKSEALRARLKDFRQAEALRNVPAFDTARFKKDMAGGKQLVDEFTQIEQRLHAARQFSAKPEMIKELETLADAKAKELNASFHAKNFLKSTGGEVEKLASTRIEQLYKKVDAKFKELMAAEKWDMRYLKFKEFRNASSRGRIGMDRDYGLVEDEVTLLVKNGKKSSIYQIQKDGQAAYKKAYEEVMQQSYEKSFQEFTTRAHSESFRDIKVLNDLRNPKNVAQLERMWGEQTARTIEFKGLHMLNDPKLNPHMTLLDRHLEASRGLAKELDKKIIPFLQNAKAAPGIDLKKIKETEEHFRGIKQILDDFSTNKIDPVAASEKLRAYTGGKDLPQVLDQVRNVTEALFKFGAVGK